MNKVNMAGADGCWLWTATKNNMGYGMLTAWDDRRARWAKKLAHRLSYELHCGQIPDGALVLHRCDTPACVNPAHLYLGNHLRNNRDMWERGRARPVPAKRLSDGTVAHPPPPPQRNPDGSLKYPPPIKRGQDNTNSKLTGSLVLGVYARRLAGETCTAIAKSLGVERTIIKDVCAGKNWAHMLNHPDAPTLRQLSEAGNFGKSKRLTDELRAAIRLDLAAGLSPYAAAKKHGVDPKTAKKLKPPCHIACATQARECCKSPRACGARSAGARSPRA